jgi:hypothetical protein
MSAMKNWAHDGKSLGILLLIWICFIVRGVFYSVLFPIWEGYDEHVHFAFIQHLIHPGGLPGIHEQVSKEIEESLKLVPLPWLLRNSIPGTLTHDMYWNLPDSERIRRQQALMFLPRGLSQSPSMLWLPIYEAKQPPLYYVIFSLPMRLISEMPLADRVFFLRCLAVLLTSVFVPLGFRIAMFVFSDQTLALMVVSLAAAMPELLIDIARVGNECMGIGVFCLVLYYALRFAGAPTHSNIAAMLGLSLGLGLITKAYFLTAAAAVFCIIVAAVLSKGRHVLMSTLTICLGSFAISGWWYWHNHAMGEWSGSPVSRLLGNIRLVRWYTTIDSMFLSHIWFGNWSFMQLRSWMYHLMGMIFVAAFIGLLVLTLQYIRKQAPPPFLANWHSLGVPSVFYFFFIIGLLYFALITYTYTGVSGIPGWYMYCLVVAEVILLAAGLFALAPRRWIAGIVPVITALFCLIDLYATHFILIPYYTGLIAHKTNGALPAFHVAQFSEFPIALHRLQANRPMYLTSGVVLAVWCLYLVATFALFLVSFRMAQKSRQGQAELSG